MIDNQLPEPLAHLGVSAHIPDSITGPAREWLEERRAEATAWLLDQEAQEPGRAERAEEAFRMRERRERRERQRSNWSEDGMHSRCYGCGERKPLWELGLVKVAPAELPEGAPMRLRLVCLDHGVPAVKAPAHEWVRITPQTREQADRQADDELMKELAAWRRSRDAEVDAALADINGSLIRAGMSEGQAAARAARQFPPIKPLPAEVPEAETVGFWRRLTGQRGRTREV